MSSRSLSKSGGFAVAKSDNDSSNGGGCCGRVGGWCMMGVNCALDCLIRKNMPLVFLYTALLTVFAYMDAFNRYTVPILYWKWMFAISIIPPFVSICYMFYRTYYLRFDTDITALGDSIGQEGVVTKGLRGGTADANDLERQFHRNRALSAIQFVFSVVVGVGLLFRFADVEYIYHKTTGTDGAQQALDDGFDSSLPLDYVHTLKMDMLQAMINSVFPLALFLLTLHGIAMAYHPKPRKLHQKISLSGSTASA